MSEGIERVVLIAGIAGTLAVFRWCFLRFFPRQAAWLSKNVGARQRKLGAALLISGLLFLILMTVLRMLLKIHQNPSWPWSVAFWAGAALMALGILLIALEGLFGGGQAAPKVKER